MERINAVQKNLVLSKFHLIRDKFLPNQFFGFW